MPSAVSADRPLALLCRAISGAQTANKLNWPIASNAPWTWDKCEFLPNSGAPATPYGAGVSVFCYSLNGEMPILLGLLLLLMRSLCEDADTQRGASACSLGLRRHDLLPHPLCNISSCGLCETLSPFTLMPFPSNMRLMDGTSDFPHIGHWSVGHLHDVARAQISCQMGWYHPA